VPDAVFLDIRLPGPDGVSLATQLAMLPQPPRVVFTTGHAERAPEAFRLAAVDYLLKPLDPEQVDEAVERLLAHLRPFEAGPSRRANGRVEEVTTPDKLEVTCVAGELLPVKDVDRDQVRLLARHEIAAALRTKTAFTWWPVNQPPSFNEPYTRLHRASGRAASPSRPPGTISCAVYGHLTGSEGPTARTLSPRITRTAFSTGARPVPSITQNPVGPTVPPHRR
jgi:Response regulator receiver domain